MNMNLDREAGTITQGDIAIGKAVARLAGGFQTPGEAQVMNLRLGAPDMPVDELEAMLPSLGVVLPSASSADLSISGPLDRLVIAGPVRMSNTKLAGFDMGSKLGALSAFSGKAPSSRDTTRRGGDRGGVAFMIQGTTSSPKFVPDVGSIAGNAARGAI